MTHPNIYINPASPHENNLNSINTKIYKYKEIIYNNNLLITNLKKTIQSEKNKCLIYENKFKNINTTYLKFEQNKSKLKESIYNLKITLNLTKTKNQELEKLILAKEDKITTLKEDMKNLQDTVASLVSK